MTSIKEQWIANVVASLDTISVANAYYNNMGLSTQVFDINNVQWKTPCNVISTGNETYADHSYGVIRCSTTLIVDSYIVHTRKSGDAYENQSTETVLNNLVSDIIKALMLDRSRGGKAVDTVPIQTERYILVIDNAEYMMASTQFSVMYDINQINPESTV